MKPTDVKSQVSRELLDRLFDIRPEEGLIYWRRASRKPWLNGKLAGHANHHFRYVMICIKGKDFKRHRLIWFYVNGRWPDEELDHINGDRADDRIGNLRQASKCQNMWNAVTPKTNTSGRKGVSWCNGKQRWIAKITVERRQIGLGLYAAFSDAVAAREVAEKRYHREYARAA